MQEEYSNPFPHRAGLIGPVFHGTCNVFNEFSLEKIAPSGLYGPGFYFTDDPEIASSYAKPRDLKWKSKKIRKKAWMIAFKKTTKKDDLDFLMDSYNNIKNNFDLSIIYPDVFEDLQIDIVPFTETNCIPNVWVAYLDIKHPFDARKKYNPEDILEDIFEVIDFDSLSKKRMESEFRNFLRAEGFRKKIPGSEVFNALVNLPKINVSLQTFFGVYTGEIKTSNAELAVTLFLQLFNYDGIIYRGGEVLGTKKHTAYVVWNPEQIVNISQKVFS